MAEGDRLQPERAEDGAPAPRHLTMATTPGEIGVQGASASFRTRVPFEPAAEQTREALARRIDKLEDRLKAGFDTEFTDRRWQEIFAAVDALESVPNEICREQILDGIAAALSLGLMHLGGSAVAAERTKAAVDAIRTPKIIKDSITASILVKRRELRYKLCRDTSLARTIVDDVSRDIDLAPAAPVGWEAYYRLEPPLASRPTTDPTRRKFKDALRQVIGRMDN